MGFKYLPAFVCATWKQSACIRKRKIKILGLWTQTRGGTHCSVAEEVTHEVSGCGGSLGPLFCVQLQTLVADSWMPAALEEMQHTWDAECVSGDWWCWEEKQASVIHVCLFFSKVWVLYENWYYYWPSLISSLNCHQFKLFNRVIYLKENWYHFFLHRGSIISTKVFSSFVIANFTGVPKEKKKTCCSKTQNLN